MRGLVFSIFVHAAIIAGGMIYLPRAAHVYDTPLIVPVELVTLSDMTSVRASAPEPEEVEEAAIEDETIEDEIIDPAPAPELEPVIEPEVEFIDTEPEVEPEAEPVVEEEPEPEPEPEPVRPEPQRVVQPRQETPAEPSLADLLGDLEREVADARTEAGAPDEGVQRRAVGDGARMTATLVDLMRAQTYRCWRTVADMPNPETLGVKVEVRLNRDGSLSAPPQVEDEGRIRASGNPFWQTAAERARAAVIECAPYQLPQESFSEWRLIEVNFQVDFATG